MGVHNVANAAEFKSALANNKIVVVDAFATWCGPCKVVAPKIVALSDLYTNVHFVKVDVDEVPDVAQELGIRAMPTFVIFKEEKKVGEVVGANQDAVRTVIDKILAEEVAPKPDM